MPRKRAVSVGSSAAAGGVTVNVTPDTQEDAQPSEEQREADAELKVLEAENPRGAHVEIWRVHRLTGHKSRIGKFSASIVDSDWVTEQFGGGKYWGRKFRPKKAGGFEYAGSLDFDIDETLFPPKIPSWAPAAQQPATAPAQSVAPAQGASVVDAALISLFTMQAQAFKDSTDAARADRETQQTMLQGWMERMATNSRPSTDWVELAKIFGPALLKTLGDRRDPNEIARELFETINKVTQRAPEPPSAMTEALALVDRIESRVVRRNGPAAAAGDPADDSLFGFLKGVAPELLRVYEKQLEVRADLVKRGIVPSTGAPAAAPGNGQPSLPPPAPAPTMYVPPEAVAAAAGVTPASLPAPVSGPVTDPMLPIWAPFLKPFVGEFLEYAKEGADPKVCADLLLTRLELKHQLDAAAPLIDDSTFGEQFVKAFPEFKPYAVWVELMLQAGREDLAASETDDNDGE